MSQDVKNWLTLTSTNDLLHALPKAALEELAAELETMIYDTRLAGSYYAIEVHTGRLRFNSVSDRRCRPSCFSATSTTCGVFYITTRWTAASRALSPSNGG